MCEKAMILEVKDDYCMAMLEDSRIVRIRKKEGIEEGDKIYVLEEDFVEKKQEEHSSAVLPIGAGGVLKVRKSVLRRITAAAAAIAVFVGVMSVPRLTEKAYAIVSFDGEASVQLELGKDNDVKKAVSYDHTVSERELQDMEGRKLNELWPELQRTAAEEEPVLVAGALLDSEESSCMDRLEKEVRGNLKNEKLIFLRGSQDDVKKAQEEGKSLGMYIFEKAVEEEALEQYFAGVPLDCTKAWLKKSGDKVPEAYKKKFLRHKEKEDDSEDVRETDGREAAEDRDEDSDSGREREEVEESEKRPQVQKPDETEEQEVEAEDEDPQEKDSESSNDAAERPEQDDEEDAD